MPLLSERAGDNLLSDNEDEDTQVHGKRLTFDMLANEDDAQSLDEFLESNSPSRKRPYDGEGQSRKRHKVESNGGGGKNFGGGKGLLPLQNVASPWKRHLEKANPASRNDKEPKSAKKGKKRERSAPAQKAAKEPSKSKKHDEGGLSKQLVKEKPTKSKASYVQKSLASVSGELVVKATSHGDLIQFSKTGVLDKLPTLPPTELQKALVAIVDFLGSERAQLLSFGLKSTAVKKGTSNDDFCLIKLPTDYSAASRERLMYQIQTFLPVCLSRRDVYVQRETQVRRPKGQAQTSPRRFAEEEAAFHAQVEAQAKRAQKKNEEQLRSMREEIREEIEKLQKTLDKKAKPLPDAAIDKNRLQRILDELEGMKQAVEESRSVVEELKTMKSAPVLTPASQPAVGETHHELERLKAQIDALQAEISTRRQGQSLTELSHKLAEQLSMLQEHQQKLSSANAFTPLATPNPYGLQLYTIDANRYPLGARIRVEASDTSRFQTEKASGKRIVISPGAVVVFCHSRHNGFSKVKTAVGITGWVRTKSLIPHDPQQSNATVIESKIRAGFVFPGSAHRSYMAPPFVAPLQPAPARADAEMPKRSVQQATDPIGAPLLSQTDQSVSSHTNILTQQLDLTQQTISSGPQEDVLHDTASAGGHSQDAEKPQVEEHVPS
ncbi:hypothetical protein DIPPA_22060 [Diplonema papillatum]|nr:hypothetical protein DIPPA_22060 [Diplonema papillatum]